MANNKRFLYVGGLADEVDVNLLKSTFSAFGDLVDVNMPIDFTAQKHKGFAFIEFQWPEDAADAIDNLDNGEILGRTIRVNLAKPQNLRVRGTSENQTQSAIDMQMDVTENERVEQDIDDITETNDHQDPN